MPSTQAAIHSRNLCSKLGKSLFRDPSKFFEIMENLNEITSSFQWISWVNSPSHLAYEVYRLYCWREWEKEKRVVNMSDHILVLAGNWAPSKSNLHFHLYIWEVMEGSAVSASSYYSCDNYPACYRSRIIIPELKLLSAKFLYHRGFLRCWFFWR